VANIKPKIRVPKTAKVGDVIKIKTLISHPMESGIRKNKKTRELIPRDIINHFEAHFEGQPFFSADMHPAISADPYFAFYFKVPGPGTFSFTWNDDKGNKWSLKQSLLIA